MALVQSATFVANYQTNVVFGRSLTTVELAQAEAIRETALNAGRQCTTALNTQNDQLEWVSTTYWTSADDANSYAAAANAFSPAPTTLCTVIAI